jgi:Phytanoyl-CoA dioxygenase (PhyH)
VTLRDLSERFALVDFESVHNAIAADRDACALAGPGTDGLGPIVLRLGGQSVTVEPGRPVRVVSGASPTAQVDVEFASARAFTDFFHELRSAPGAQVTGSVKYHSGGYLDFDSWEPALRALYQRRSVYDPSAVDRSRMTRVFTHGVDSVEEIGAFVREFGFAIVRGVFSAEEVSSIDAAVSRLESESTPHTLGTWWTTGSDGNGYPCQIHYVTQKAAEIAWVDDDERMTNLRDSAIPGLVSHPDRGNGTFAVLKRPGATAGLTNLAWHIDCGLGGHTVTCPGLHIGIQLTESNPSKGAFTVLAGSHESSVRRDVIDGSDLPVVVVATQPGDVTIHVPHVMHAAPAPVGDAAGRRTLYLGYTQQLAHDLIGPGQSFDDLISQTSDDGYVSFDPT